jgi:hypothetical protein
MVVVGRIHEFQNQEILHNLSCVVVVGLLLGERKVIIVSTLIII